MSPAAVDSRKLVPIVGVLKDYAWGLSGAESLASALHCSNSGDSVETDKPAAELWLGTHSSGPSMAKDGNMSLRDAIGGDLPFLLKVLSVARPLSIQAHPDKARAERLHAERPDKYKDDNHKPEMAVAITRKLYRPPYFLYLRHSNMILYHQLSRACATSAIYPR